MWFRNIFGASEGLASRQAGPGSKGPSELVLSAHALRQLNRMQLNTHPDLSGYAGGLRPSQRRKPAYDFREYRVYTPGDDVRFVDWKASGRQEHIFIKQGEQQKDAAVYVLLDCSASMVWGEPPKFQALLSIAAALGYLALAQGDRLMVVPLFDRARKFPASLQPLGPIHGKGLVPHLLNYLRALPFRGQVDLAQSLAGFARRYNIRGGLVVVLSDLLGEQDLAKGLASLPLPTWNLVICHLLHPAELNPVVRGDFEMQDIETGQMKRYAVTDKAISTYRQRLQAWLNSLEATCMERKARYTMIPTDWHLESQIIPHLREVNVVKPQ